VVRAEREVVLCAGAVRLTQLLLLSGMGPADELRQVGVQVRHELRGVGRNLQDHTFVTIIWEVTDQQTLYGADKPKPMAEWVLRRTGPLSSTVAEVSAFVRTRGGLAAADIQFHMGAAYFEDHGAGGVGDRPPHRQLRRDRTRLVREHLHAANCVSTRLLLGSLHASGALAARVNRSARLGCGPAPRCQGIVDAV
jgi:choline dehydrogenase-like flavoprotein